LPGLPKPTMSFIDLEFMGGQSRDIMADSVDTKQMLLTLSSED